MTALKPEALKMTENRCSVKHQVNSCSADEHDERDASQLRRSRVLLVG